MKRLLLRSAIVVVVGLGLTLPVLADTIRLKDGSVLRGEIVNFRNEQFTILVGSGARGRKSRITVYMEDVESIEFEGAPADERVTPRPRRRSQLTSRQPIRDLRTIRRQHSRRAIRTLV